MNEHFENAVEEMKRVDHLIYVSLKYTRTVDVIRNTLIRIIASFDEAINALLKHSGVEDLPTVPKAKVDLIRQKYPDKQMDAFMTFYQYLRKLMRSDFDRREEYRRHVTMITKLEKHRVEVNIDNLETTYERMARNFINLVYEKLKEKPDKKKKK
ncbi:MAG: hypothetical protein QW331_03350 [Candidatus Woesearchaeota archaeon]